MVSERGAPAGAGEGREGGAMGEDTATRIRTADGATITIERTTSGLFGRLRVDYHGVVSVAILDRDDLAALADACTTLAEEIAGDDAA